MARPALSAERSLRVLNFLAAHPDESFTLSDLVRRVRVNVASMHALLAVLEEHDYVVRPDGKHYRLGPMLVPLGRAALRANRTMASAGELVRSISGALDLTGLVVRANAGDLVIVDEFSPGNDRAPGIGQRIPMLPPIGGVFFAWADDAATDDWIAGAPRAVIEAEPDLRRWLASIRERGYAVGLETTARHGLRRAVRDLGESPGSKSARGRLQSSVAHLGDIATVVIEFDARDTYDVAHVAAPVVDPSGQCTTSLYLMGFRRPLTRAEIETIGTRLHHAASSLARLTPELRGVSHGSGDDGSAPEGIW